MSIRIKYQVERSPLDSRVLKKTHEVITEVHTVGPSPDPSESRCSSSNIIIPLLTTAPEFETRKNEIVEVSTGDVFCEAMAAAERLQGVIRMQLNSQHCDETQRKIHGRDRLRKQYGQTKNPTNELWSPES